MAKIFLKNGEVIFCDDAIGVEVERQWFGDRNGKSKIRIPDQGGTRTLVTNRIVDVKVGVGPDQAKSQEKYQEKLSEFEQYVSDSHKKRREFLKLSPREKAEQYSWGHFQFFYNGVYGKNPPVDDGNLRQRVVDYAEKFYKNNPFIDRVTMALWQKFLDIPDGTTMSRMHYNILSLQDSMAIKNMRDDTEFEQKRRGIELSIPVVVY